MGSSTWNGPEPEHKDAARQVESALLVVSRNVCEGTLNHYEDPNSEWTMDTLSLVDRLTKESLEGQKIFELYMFRVHGMPVAAKSLSRPGVSLKFPRRLNQVRSSRFSAWRQEQLDSETKHVRNSVEQLRLQLLHMLILYVAQFGSRRVCKEGVLP